MPFKNPEDKRAWRRASYASGQTQLYQDRCLARKLGFNIPHARKYTLKHAAPGLTPEMLVAIEASKQPTYYEALCQSCSKPFTTKWLGARYCSTRCNNRTKRLSQRPHKPLIDKECAICSTPFRTPNPRTTTCCPAHSKENETRRRKFAAIYKYKDRKIESDRKRHERERTAILALRELGFIDNPAPIERAVYPTIYREGSIRYVSCSHWGLFARYRIRGVDKRGPTELRANGHRRYWNNRTAILAAKELGIIN